jgi:hypothetical protein
LTVVLTIFMSRVLSFASYSYIIGSHAEQN